MQFEDVTLGSEDNIMSFFLSFFFLTVYGVNDELVKGENNQQIN